MAQTQGYVKHLVRLAAFVIAGALAGTALAQEESSGTITVAIQGSDTQTWNALAAAYEEFHPGVDVTIELKPGEGYQEYLRSQFAGGTPSASLVNGNVVQDLLNAGEFLDMSPYLDAENPYTGQPWEESFAEGALDNMRDPVLGRDQLNYLNYETVQVLWLYNKAAFERAGILGEAEALAQTERNQPTFEQLLGWCDALTEVGVTPVAIEGDFASFWEMRFGWLARMYLDQFTRDEAELVRCQEGDYCFREGVDDVWRYDPRDPFNDDGNKVSFNPARQMIALRDHVQAVDGPAFRELYTNLKAFGDRCAPQGWIGTADAYPLFLTQKAAMRLDFPALLTNLERDVRNLAAGEYQPAGAAEGETLAAQDASVFDLGTFNNPTMEGAEVDAPARTIEVSVGFWSIPRKDRQQNDLEVDFLMFLTSPEGTGVYLQNKLDTQNPNGGIAGPPVVAGAELPAAVAERFSSVKLIGNTEKPTPGNYRSRGVYDYQPSVREWVDLSQQYFGDRITLDEFLSSYQASVDRLFPEILEHVNLTEEDLASPEKQPISQE